MADIEKYSNHKWATTIAKNWAGRDSNRSFWHLSPLTNSLFYSRVQWHKKFIHTHIYNATIDDFSILHRADRDTVLHIYESPLLFAGSSFFKFPKVFDSSFSVLILLLGTLRVYSIISCLLYLINLSVIKFLFFITYNGAS